MNITKSEKKPGVSITNRIGIWKGELKYINPTAAQLKEIYGLDEVPEEPKYQGTDKNSKDWSLLRFIFIEEVAKIPVEFKVFMSKDIASFDKDSVTKTWHINQWGESQLVADEKDLFRSFTHFQKYNDESKKFEDVIENGDAIKLQYRPAYKGETSLYGLLRKLVTQDWFNATPENTLFIKIDHLMRGAVKDITSLIGTDNFQPVVGMCQIEAKDGENGTEYYQNCVDQAWMPGWKYKEAIQNCSTHGWDKYENKASGKGKGREMYQFYQACKRNRNMIEFAPLHEFNKDSHLQAGTSTFQISPDSKINDTDY